MCDTLVALGTTTADGSVLFAKNSDRELNEAQVLTFVPPKKYADGEVVQCTYLQIPQARETFATLLCRPFWMWGAEMGVNEYGVTIGNEAVFTKEPIEKKGGLLGMDMLRLALERTSSAKSALELIIKLLGDYGQGGNCGYSHKMFYHNSFIIADHTEAWVLETAGEYWAVKKVQDFYSISNGITIANDFDMASPGLVEHAIEKGWCRNKTEFDFARNYSDWLFTKFSSCRIRQQRTSHLLSEEIGLLTPAAMMAILRDHGPDDLPGNGWRPAPGSLKTVCVHAGFGPTRDSQSVGSLVMHLDNHLDTAWVTGTSAPCTSIFKPVWVRAGFPDLGSVPEGTFNLDTLWWEHEELHRAMLKDYPASNNVVLNPRIVLEEEFLDGVANLPDQESATLRAYSEVCFQRAGEFTKEMIPLVQAVPVRQGLPPFYRLKLRQLNQQANLPI